MAGTWQQGKGVGRAAVSHRGSRRPQSGTVARLGQGGALMRVLVVCKRQYSCKDVMSDRFGRLYELPLGLTSLGDDVRICALSYRRRRGPSAGRFEGTSLEWRSLN